MTFQYHKGALNHILLYKIQRNITILCYQDTNFTQKSVMKMRMYYLDEVHFPLKYPLLVLQ